MRLAVSKDGEGFNDPIIVKTPQDFNEGMSLFEKTARGLLGGEKIKAAAGGIAGPLDFEKTKLVNSPNLPGWAGKPLKENLRTLFDAPVYLENDAAIVGLGEVVAGAGKGARIAAYLTVSTGIGGARFIDDKIDRSAFGFEPGHQIIDLTEELCPTCGLSGHLEGHVSGAALEKRFGKKPYEITDSAIWEEMAQWLAYGLNNTIVHWSPEIVVLGGSMITKEPGISIDRVRFYLEKTLLIFPERPRLVKAFLGDVGGLHGALVLLKQNFAN